MSSTEDRLRAATRAAGATVTPGSIPPLRLPEAGSRRPRPGRRHARTWLVPLGAAAAVAAVVTGSLTAAHVIGAGRAQAARHRITPVPGPDGLPPYYIRRAGFTGPISAGGTRLGIYATATGRAVSTATLPGRVTILAAGGGTGTFFAATWGTCAPSARWGLPCRATGRPTQRTVFYRITLTATGARVSLLPIPPTGLVQVMGAAPDGSKLAFRAVMLPPPVSGASTLTVASTATGRERHWSTNRPGSLMSTVTPISNYISWFGGSSRLAFPWQTGRNQLTLTLVLHVLDTSAPGTGLLAGTALVPPKRAGRLAGQAISPDGSTVIATVPGGPGGPAGIPDWSVVSFPAGTGQPVRVLFAAKPDRYGKHWSCRPLWVSHTGQRVVIGCAYHPPGGGSLHQVFLAGPGGALRRLPWLDSPATAFDLGSMPER